jgi:hypothetical protein
MQPIGLTLKNREANPFTGRTSGELMIVHYCQKCSIYSANRIAGDDNVYAIEAILDMEGSPVVIPNINLLNCWDREMVEEILLGRVIT